MKKFLYGAIFTILLVCAVTNGIFIFLFVQESGKNLNLQVENKNLSEEVSSLEAEVQDNNNPNINTFKTLTFQDKAMEIEFDYREDWKVELDTKITDEFAYDPIYGRIAQGYTINVGTDDVTLEIEVILGAIDGFPSGFKNGDYEVVEVGSDIIRIKNDLGEWGYVIKLEDEECSQAPIGLTDFDVCYSPFSPSFGKFANNVTVVSDSEDLLKMADEIVLNYTN